METINITLSDLTPKLLMKYGWELRHHQYDTLLPESEFKKVNEQINLSFQEDFIWEGSIPYITFSNLLGIKEDFIKKSDEDSVIFLIAPPGKGKSTQSLGWARFIDPSFTNERTIFTMKQLKKFLNTVSKEYKKIVQAREKGAFVVSEYAGKALVLDEGVYLLFSGDAQSKNGKLAQKLFSIIRALNLIVLVNVTNLRKINKGVREDRVMASVKIPTKGIIQFFSKKRMMQIKITDNDIKYPKANYYEKTGWINKECQFWKEYSLTKAQFLVEATQEDEKPKKD